MSGKQGFLTCGLVISGGSNDISGIWGSSILVPISFFTVMMEIFLVRTNRFTTWITNAREETKGKGLKLGKFTNLVLFSKLWVFGFLFSGFAGSFRDYSFGLRFLFLTSNKVN